MPTPQQDPTVSIAMATCEGARFIVPQLESLRHQTRRPLELVITDDRSSDDTLEQVRRFAADAPFAVRIVENESRLGWRGNFVKAAELCRGDLIAFCDQDDVWYPRKLEVMSRLLNDERVLLAYHDADLIDATGAITGTLRNREVDRTLLPPRARPTTWSNPLGLTLMMRRVLTRFIPYWSDSVDFRAPTMPAAHDQWFYNLAANLGFIAFTGDRLLGYRQHGGNAVGFAPSTRRSGWPRRTGGTAATDYPAMLTAFCRCLERAESDGLAAWFSELPQARDANARLLHRLVWQEGAHDDPTLVGRLRRFASLLRNRAYSRHTPWNLGYRACLNTALVGVPFGRRS